MWLLRNGWCRNFSLERRCGVVLGVTTRPLGDMDRPGPFRRALRSLGLPPNSWAGGVQVHGRRVRRATRPTAPVRLAATDGFAADVPGLALWVRAADCVPVFVLDPAHRACALVHAGWRGAHKRILTEALRRMGRWYGTRPEQAWVSLGPHIRSCCYEIGPDVARRFRAVPGAVKQRGENGLSLDLARCLCREARRAGVRDARFSSAPFCTAHDKRFFSFRRMKTKKRLAAVVAIKHDEKRG